MLSKEITQLLDDDRQHAASFGVEVFVRAAGEPELVLFRKMVGEPGGDGPRSLFVIVGPHARVFISWPRDFPIPDHTEQELRLVLDEAVKLGVPALVFDPAVRN